MWKLDESNSAEEEDKSPGRECRQRAKSPVSARKLAASLWRLRLPEFQSGVDHFAATLRCHRVGLHHHHASPGKGVSSIPNSVSASKHRPLHKFEPSFQFPNYTMEGATKWDPHSRKAWSETNQQFSNHLNLPEFRVPASTPNPILEAELDLARGRVNELETERKSSKNKLEQFLHKFSEEQAMWRTREHKKVHAIIEDTKADLKRAKKTRHKLETVNSELVNELKNTKLVAKCYLQEYEKERKTRELIEEICDELAKEIGGGKDEVKALTKESLRLCEEVEDERRMLQTAEVWREERVQMKLSDSKVMLEDKYLEMNTLVASLESFLKSSRNVASDSDEGKRAEFLMQAGRSVSMQDVRELSYKPPNQESHGIKIDMVSPEVKMLSKNTNFWGSSVSRGEVDLVRMRWEMRGSSVSKIWKNGGDSCKIVTLDGKNGRLSNVAFVSSPDDDELLGQWSSPDSGNPHTNREKNNLKSRLLQARMESQKVQLRQVLKQKI